jgi:hypothetical protein
MELLMVAAVFRAAGLPGTMLSLSMNVVKPLLYYLMV